MAEIGNAWINILPSTKGIAPGVRAALGEVEKSATRTGSVMGDNIGKALKLGMGTAGVAAGGVLAVSLAKGMGRLSAIGDAQAKLMGLGNSAQTVAGVMDNALAAVKGTAHGLGEAATAASGLVAAGVKPGQELESTLSTIASTASVAGRSMADVGLIFGSVAARGKLQGDDMLQLLSAGIPVLQMLGDELGVTSAEVSEMVSKGQVDFKTFESALSASMGSAAKVMADTASGTFANFQSALGRVGANILKPFYDAAPGAFKAATVLVDAFDAGLKPASARVGEILSPAFEKFASSVGDGLAPGVERLGGALGDVAVKAAELVSLGIDKALAPETLDVAASLWGQVSEMVSRVWGAVSPLVPSLVDLAQAFAQVLGVVSVATWQALASVLDALVPVIEHALVPLVQNVADFASTNPGAVQAIVVGFLGFKAISAVVGPVTATVTAVKNLTKAYKFLGAAFKGGGVAKGLVNVMGGIGSSNPIIAGLAARVGHLTAVFAKSWMVISPVLKFLGAAIRFVNPWVAGITAVTAALVWFFTKTETGQQALEKFKDVVSATVERVKNVFGSLVSALGGVWQWISSTAVAVWEPVKNAWDAVFGVLSAAVSAWWSNVSATLSAGWDVIKTLFTLGVDNVKQVFSALWLGIGAALRGDFSQVGEIISNAWNNIIANTAQAWERVGEIVKQWIVTVGARIFQGWEDVKSLTGAAWQFVVDKVQDFAARVVAHIVRMATSAVETVRQWGSDVVSAVRGAFDRVMEFFTQLPGKIKGVFVGSGRWLVDSGKAIISGLLDGLKSAWTSVASWFDARARDIRGFFGGVNSAARSTNERRVYRGVEHYANGGVRGESHSAQIASAGAWRVWAEPETGGEAYIPLAASKRQRSVEILGQVARMFGMGLVDRAGGQVQAFANGGVVSAAQLLDFAQGREVKGQRAPRPLEGASYTWGGELLRNWGDCSAAMSGFAALATGMAVAGRKFTTHTLEAFAAARGFTRGMGGANTFSMGVLHGGPGGGHTSGTITFGDGKRINVEMGGARGNGQIGGRAAAANHPQYSAVYHIPLAATSGSGPSQVVSTSVDGVTTATAGGGRQTTEWGSAEALYELARRGVRLFDTGGLLRHGQIAMNLSGRNEQVMTAWQWDKLVGGLTKLADAVKGTGGFGGFGGFGQLGRLAGERFAELFTEATGGMAGGWVHQTQLLKDAEAGLASVRANSESTVQDIAAAETAVAQARAASTSRGFNGGSNIAAFARGASLSQIGQIVGMFDLGEVGQVIQTTLSSMSSVRKAYEDQAEASSAVAAAEANLRLARDKNDISGVTAAEQALAQARQQVQSAAIAAGQAEISMIISIAKAIFNLINTIISGVAKARAAAAKAIAESWGAQVEYAKLLEQSRENVVSLRHAQVMAAIEVAAAWRQLRITQLEGVAKQHRAAVELAKAQAAFDAQRRADMRLAALNYDDLSLAYNRFRWQMSQGNQEAFNELAAWSDKSRELHAELMAAQVEKQLAEKKAQRDALEASYRHTLAVMDLKDATRSLELAAAQLAVMNGQSFGMNSQEAFFNKRLGDLMARKAELQAQKSGNWWRIFSWHLSGAGRAADQEIANIDRQIAEMQSMPQWDTMANKEAFAKQEELMRMAGRMGFFGGSAHVEMLIRSSQFGDAARALESAQFQQELLAMKEREDKLRALMERNLAEIEHRNQLAPLDTEISGLESEKEAYKTWAEYWRAEDAKVRESLAALAKHQEDAAAMLKDMAARPMVVEVNLPEGKEAYSAREVQAAFAQFGAAVEGLEVRVRGLESPAVGAGDVAMSRR